MSTWLIISTAVIVSAGCGTLIRHESDSSDEKWTYHFTENGCDTGEHSYRSKEEYCLGLRDDNTNRGCASRMRTEALKKDC